MHLQKFIPIKNKHHYDVLPRNKDLKLSIPHTCNAPSRQLLIDFHGDCFVCGCEAWLPISVGHITEFTDLHHVWENSIAQQLQATTQAGSSFEYCAVTRCDIQKYDLIHNEYTVSINIDESCNLWCPSCRSKKTMITDGDQFEKKQSWVKHVVDLLEKFDEPTRIIMSGNGDPLASAIMRPLVRNFRPRPSHWIKLFTNGLLLKKQLSDTAVIEKIDEYLMSIDAGSKEVYEKIRLGGKWEILMENFDWLKLNAKKNAKIDITAVIQKLNYQDLDNFCQLAIKYGWGAGITRLDNWATWMPEEFKYHNVMDPSHPDYIDALEVLLDIESKYNPPGNEKIGLSAALRFEMGLKR